MLMTSVDSGFDSDLDSDLRVYYYCYSKEVEWVLHRLKEGPPKRRDWGLALSSSCPPGRVGGGRK